MLTQEQIVTSLFRLNSQLLLQHKTTSVYNHFTVHVDKADVIYSCSYCTSTVVSLILLENYTLDGILLRHYYIDYIVSTGKLHT